MGRAVRVNRVTGRDTRFLKGLLMATFPTNENDVKALAAQMEAGYIAHPTDFPSVTVADLTAALGAYNVALAGQQNARAAAKAATSVKESALTDLVAVMKTDLKLSEVDTAGDPVKLDEIGWGTKSPPTPLAEPGSPRDLAALNEGPGTLDLQWNKPADGGAVRNYVIQRNNAGEPATAGLWQTIQFAYGTTVPLTEQPRGVQLEYRVLSSNATGMSGPGNTVPVVL